MKLLTPVMKEPSKSFHKTSILIVLVNATTIFLFTEQKVNNEKQNQNKGFLTLETQSTCQHKHLNKNEDKILVLSFNRYPQFAIPLNN